jgi:ABC-2 type transport system ATP-binding protein
VLVTDGSGGIQVEGLRKTFRRGRVRALDGISLEIRSGEAFGLIGPNGAGKTTFLGCLLGLLTPDSGTIEIDGAPADDLSVRRATGYLPERLAFDRWMTGEAFLRFHHGLAGRDESARVEEVTAALRRVGLDEAAWDVPLRTYSRGMLQRLGFAQALIGRPRFLFLDEPASGVDPAGVLQFRQLLKEVKEQNVTVVLNSHQLDQVERVCDRVAFIRAGKIEAIENLGSEVETSRAITLRWIAGPDALQTRDAVAAIAKRAGAALVELSGSRATFTVPHDRAAAALLREMITSGFALAEASAETGRLERFFA